MFSGTNPGNGYNYNPTLSPALSSIGAGAGSLLSNWKNPADAASKYFSQIPGTITPYYTPYINAGNFALPQMQNQYQSLVSDPGSILNKIGSGYQQSPGYQSALKEALTAANHAAAAGGMAGSPAHEYQSQQIASDLASKDYNQWLSQALGLYGMGTQGYGNLAQMGYGASNELAQSLANSLMNQGQLQYAGTTAKGEHDSGGLGSLFGGIGSLVSSFF